MWSKGNILKYIPKVKHGAVKDFYKDDDGYWLELNKEWQNADGGRCIHEDTIRDVRNAIREITRRRS